MLNHARRIVAAGILPLLTIPAWHAMIAAEPPSLMHRAGDVAFEVTSNGLSRVTVQDRTLASGAWDVFNAESWFSPGGTNGPVRARQFQERTLELLSPSHAVVRQRRDDLLCTFDYTVTGEDVSISARVENNYAEAPLAVVGFAGLTFTFSRAPDGVMNEQHISYFQAHGIGLCHPSHWARIGGSYARDDAVGVGLSPWRTGLERTLILWDYTDWNQGKREKLPSRRLLYFVPATIPPRGVHTFDLLLRVSQNRDWKHLLEPYREHYQATFGPVRYQADPRWIATDYLNHSQRAVSLSNPYGFHGGHRRIDTTEDAAKFCDLIIPVIKTNDGQGIKGNKAIGTRPQKIKNQAQAVVENNEGFEVDTTPWELRRKK